MITKEIARKNKRQIGKVNEESYKEIYAVQLKFKTTSTIRNSLRRNMIVQFISLVNS